MKLRDLRERVAGLGSLVGFTLIVTALAIYGFWRGGGGFP